MNHSVIAHSPFSFIIAGCIILSFLGCEKLPSSSQSNDLDGSLDWVTYTILPNEHSHTKSSFLSFTDSMLHFNVVFDSSCVYQSIDPDNQLDWNKVAGFSDCNSLHQSNSLRLGWRYTPDEGIELAAYYYIDGLRGYTIVDTVQILDTTEVKLTRSTRYNTWVNNRNTKTNRHCSERPNGYRLMPYFGGDESAQDTVRIHIQWINPG